MARPARTCESSAVRFLFGLVLMLMGLLVIGGPLFGLAGLLLGGVVHVRGGALRVAFDLVVGTVLLSSAFRLLGARSSHRVIG